MATLADGTLLAGRGKNRWVAPTERWMEATLLVGIPVVGIPVVGIPVVGAPVVTPGPEITVPGNR